MTQRERTLFPLYLVFLLFNAAFFMMETTNSYFQIYLNDIGFTKMMIGTITGTASLLALVFQPVFGVCQSAEIAADKWQLPGLSVALEAKAPDFFLEKSGCGNILKVCCMSRTRVKETKQMHFDMRLTLG